jgi:hypothetical protein
MRLLLLSFTFFCCSIGVWVETKTYEGTACLDSNMTSYSALNIGLNTCTAIACQCSSNICTEATCVLNGDPGIPNGFVATTTYSADGCNSVDASSKIGNRYGCAPYAQSNSQGTKCWSRDSFQLESFNNEFCAGSAPVSKKNISSQCSTGIATSKKVTTFRGCLTSTYFSTYHYFAADDSFCNGP